MAKMIRSPGQRRKVWVRSFVGVLALAAFFFAWNTKGPDQRAAIALTQSHDVAQATVEEAWVEEEEYRTLKGKRRHRSSYYLTYEFYVDDVRYESTSEISSMVYDVVSNEEQVVVWYAPDQPQTNSLELSTQLAAATNPVERLFAAGKYIIPAAIVLNLILSFLFVREPKGKLPEGFYTDSSWLDVDDGALVALDDNRIISVSIHKKAVDEVQTLYQRGAAVEEMIDAARGKVVRVPIEDISHVSSDHFRDTISISYQQGEESSSVSLEFLTAAVKQHALERIASKLPDSLVHSDNQFGRLKAATPSLVISVLLIALVVLYFESPLFIALAVLVALFSLKTMLARVINPTRRSIWAVSTTA